MISKGPQLSPEIFIKSPKKTPSLFVFGISIPRLVFPGCEEILAERERLITRVERLEGAMDILVPERRQGAD